MRAIILFLVVVNGILGVSVFKLKNNFIAKQTRLDDLEVLIRETKEAIAVAEAEWHFVTSPQYLKNLAQKYSKLKAPTPAQIITLADLPPVRLQSYNIPEEVFEAAKQEAIKE